MEKHSVWMPSPVRRIPWKNPVHSLDIMIPGPVTVFTIPLVVVTLEDDSNRCVANWIERPRMMDRSSRNFIRISRCWT